MLGQFGDRQQALLRALNQLKSGLTADELAAQLGVSRPAVKQHLEALEQGGFVQKAGLRLTRGRPGRAYQLSPRGADLFPKQYSWFSSLLLDAIKRERGSEGLAEHLRGLAATIAAHLAPRVEGLTGAERTREIVQIMNELSYEAEVAREERGDTVPGAAAHNCVYHALAQAYPEVCQFDLELLARLSDAAVEHRECLVRGGGACRFAFRPK